MPHSLHSSTALFDQIIFQVAPGSYMEELELVDALQKAKERLNRVKGSLQPSPRSGLEGTPVDRSPTQDLSMCCWHVFDHMCSGKNVRSVLSAVQNIVPGKLVPTSGSQ